eukprot:g844.t1
MLLLSGTFPDLICLLFCYQTLSGALGAVFHVLTSFFSEVFQLLHDRTDCGTLCLHLPAKYGHLPQALRRIIRKAISTRTIDTEWTRAKHSGVWKPEWLELHENEEVEVLKHDVSSAFSWRTLNLLPLKALLMTTKKAGFLIGFWTQSLVQIGPR